MEIQFLPDAKTVGSRESPTGLSLVPKAPMRIPFFNNSYSGSCDILELPNSILVDVVFYYHL
jgi:hypothetical protein